MYMEGVTIKLQQIKSAALKFLCCGAVQLINCGIISAKYSIEVMNCSKCKGLNIKEEGDE